MSETDSSPSAAKRAWPAWVRAIVSLILILHFLAILGMVLDVQTGPWVIPDGSGMAHAPAFARKISQISATYRDTLQLVENYRFPTNARQEAAHRLEIRMKGPDGKDMGKVLLPDPKASLPSWHRQLLVAQMAAEYRPIDPPEGEKIPPPGQAVPTVSRWKRTEDGTSATLERVPEHLLPRSEDLVAPTDYALTLVRSLQRFAKKKYGADSAEVVLISRPTFGAVTLMPEFSRQLQADDFDAVEFRFGESP